MAVVFVICGHVFQIRFACNNSLNINHHLGFTEYPYSLVIQMRVEMAVPCFSRLPLHRPVSLFFLSLD